MKNTIRIGSSEAVFLLVNMICAKIGLNVIRVLEETAGPAAWLLIIYIFILANIWFFFIVKLFERFPGKDIIDISAEIAGNIGKFLVGIIIFASMLFEILLFLRGYCENMKVVSFTLSPLSFIMVFFIISMIISCFFGLEPIIRLHTIGIPLAAVMFTFIGILNIPQLDFSNIFPILGLGPDKIFIDGFLKLSIYTDLIFLFFLPPFLGSFKAFKSVGYIAIAASGLFYLLFSLTFVLLFPYFVGLETSLAVYSMSRMINLGRFVERIEPVFLIGWSLSAIFFLSASMYFIMYTFAKVFKLPYIRPLIIPFAILIYNISFIPRNLPETVKLVTVYYYNWTWIPTFILPTILLISSLILKKGGKQNAESKKQ